MSWHRDNVNRTYGVGSDWDEARHPYQIVRVGIYLFYNHHRYYRHLRSDLEYKPIPSELAAKLRAADLYPRIPKPVDKIENAWLPSKPHPILSRLYRQ